MPIEDLTRHADFLRSLARALLGNDAYADDVVQEAMAVGLRSAPRDPARVRGWLAGIVRNLSLAHRRAEGRRRKRHENAPPPEAPSSPDEVLARIETEKLLMQAVEELDEPYRSAIVHRFLDGYAPRVIAEHAGVSVRTIESRLRRGLEQLRGKLARHRKDWRALLAPIAALPLFSSSAAAATPLLSAGVVAAAGVSAVLLSGVLVWQSTERTGAAGDSRVARRTTTRAEQGPTELEARPAAEPANDAPRLLLYHLRFGDYAKRRESIAAIEAMEARAVYAIPTLTELLADRDDRWGHMRDSLARTLANLLPASVEAIRSLARHQNATGRMGAARVIGFAGTRMPGAVELLTPLAFDKANVRAEALFALAELGPAGAELFARSCMSGKEATDLFDRSALLRAGRHVVPALARRLSDTNPVVRERAALALRWTGRDLRIAANELRVALADESLGRRASLILAVRSAGMSDLLPTDMLNSMLVRGNRAELAAAARVLRESGRGTDEASVPTLVALMADADFARRTAAAEQLVGHARYGAEAIDLLWKEAVSGNALAQGAFARHSSGLDPEEWIPRYREAIENNTWADFAGRCLIAIGDRGLEALLPIADRLTSMTRANYAVELLASARHRRAGVELANRELAEPFGFWLIVSCQRRKISLEGLQTGLRASIDSGHSGAEIGMEALVRLEGARCLPLLRAIAADPEHRLKDRARGLIESIGAKKKVPPAVELDELRKRVAGHALYKRWRVALEIHELFGDWSPAHTMLDENMRSGRELELLTRHLASMKGNRADALADLERLLEHPDDCVRETAVACVAKWGEDAVSLHARIEALASDHEPDADVRYAARQILD